ncbi:MAG: DNA mismatch repair endonuclease MutL [Vampirovibrionales bacterium]
MLSTTPILPSQALSHVPHLGKIQRLPASVVSRIAAGEVVERPASVVKELVENALDAGATRIEIHAQQGGLWLRIADNGSGIHPDDLPLVFENHATSKLTHCTLEGIGFLEDIQTMGFRGEAVASIASVARVRCITRHIGQEDGYQVVYDPTKHEVRSPQLIACEVGTTFEIEDLFFNIPARRAFLKKPATELATIDETLQQLALGSPHVKFKYFQQEELKWQTLGTGDIREVLAVFHCGKQPEAQEAFKAMFLPIAFDAPKDGLKLTGWAASPSSAKWHKHHKKAWQSFVNQRPIRSPEILKAIQDAYHALIPDKTYPLVHLSLQCPVGFVDVNVHPAKREVRFRSNQAVYLTVYQGLKEALSYAASHQLLTGKALPPTTLDPQEAFAHEAGLTHSNTLIPPTFQPDRLLYTNVSPDNTDLSTLRMHDADTREEVSNRLTITESLSTPTLPSLSRVTSPIQLAGLPQSSPSTACTPQTSLPLSTETSNPWRVIGQMAQTYILLETAQGLMVVDQHIASERVWYETFMTQLLDALESRQENASTVMLHSQLLVVPQSLVLSPSQWACVTQWQSVLETLGFVIELPHSHAPMTHSMPDSHESLHEGWLKGVPALFLQENVRMPQPFTMMMSLLEELMAYTHAMSVQHDEDAQPEALRGIIQQWSSDYIATMACHRAVRAGDTLTSESMAEVVKAWLACKLPWSCPHGRPIAHTVTLRELNHFFERPSLPVHALTSVQSVAPSS